MRSLSFAILLIIALPASAEGNWTNGDTYRQIAVGLTYAFDAAQTHEIARDPAHYETNPIMGRDPSPGEINRYFLGAFALHTAIMYALPHKYRECFQYFTIVVEGSAIIKNYRAGIRIKF